MANSKKTAPKGAPAEQAQAPERSFIIKESALAPLIQQIHELPFRVANPMLQHLQQNLQEVAPAQVKESKDVEA